MNFKVTQRARITNIVSICSHSVLWLGEGLSILLPHPPISCAIYPLPDDTLPVDI